MKLSVYLVCLFQLAYSRKLPSFVEICHKSDPNLSKCIVKNIELLRLRLLEGIPELTVPSFNPFRISEVKLNSGSNLNMTLSNIKLYGLQNFIIDDLKFDFDKPDMKINLTFPEYKFEGDYSLKGKLLLFQIDGSGVSTGDYKNVKGNLSATGVYFMKNGKKYLKLGTYETDLDVGKPHLEFTNIFGNNEELNAQTNKIINENIEEVFEEFKPIVSQIVASVAFDSANRVFQRYPHDELFPA